MNLHSLTNTEGARKPRKRLGRGMGSGTGKTCGKGHKGQLARKGHKRKQGFEGGQMRLVRRVPKRGFNNPTHKEYAPVNVGLLDCFDEGTEITQALLVKRGLANGIKTGVKVLGNGELTKKLTVKVQAYSETAKAKIEAAGGTCEVTTV